VQFQLEKSKEALLTIDKVKSKGYVSFALELKGDMHSDLGDIEKAYQSYEAALSELDESAERPLLQLKLDNAAPFNGKFVRSETQLSQAVREAEELLRSKETDDQTSN
jgi:tetratricopeptide (TPR) repeat protein